MALKDINLSQGNLEGHLGELEQKIGELNALIGEYRIKKSEICNFWDDDDARAYTDTVENNIKVCERALQDVTTEKQQLEMILQNVMTMNTNVKGYIDRAATMVGNLLVE